MILIPDMAKLEEKRSIRLESGIEATASAPVIISASRRTDIPAFYSGWFFDRLQKGYSAWINPYNRKRQYISYHNTKFIVFWSKNPEPLLKYIDLLKERGIGCYIQFTLNDYEQNALESGLAPLQERIHTFRALAERLGKAAVIWRFDPLLLTADINIGTLLARVRNIGGQLHKYTEKLVFSFADIFPYARVRANLDRKRIPYIDWTPAKMREFSARLVQLNRSEGWDLKLASCGEAAELAGIEHNQCVDPRLILRLSGSPELRSFFAAKGGANACGAPTENLADLASSQIAMILKDTRDRGQRKACGCDRSKDIGQYNTCPHLCEYCYANYGRKSVMRNYALHMASPYGELIAG